MRFITILLISITLNLRAQESPVFTLETVSTTASTVTLALTAHDFTNIASGDLKILYNPAVALPAAVTRGPDLSGTFDFNLSDPGVIRIGWFTYPAERLTDGSVVFNIEFNKVSTGTSIISFDGTISDMDCQFYNGSHQKLNDEPFTAFYNSGSLTFYELTGPVTSAPVLTATSDENIHVPITVSNFNTIGAVSLLLEYDTAVLDFITAENTGGFPGTLIFNPIPGAITVSGMINDQEGFSLPDGSVFFTLKFTWLGGTTELKWIDDGQSCEYKGPLSAYIFPDTPQIKYYINGRVSPCTVPEAPALLITQPSCDVSSGTIEITSPLGAEYTYSIDGTNYQNSPKFSGLLSGSYNVTVKSSGGCISPATTVIIQEQPPMPVRPLIDVTAATCEAAGNASITNYNATYHYTFTPAGPVAIAGGNITGFVTGQFYTVTAGSTEGCESAASESFTIEGAPEAPVPVITPDGPAELCAGRSVILTAGKGESYIWSSGETTQSIVVTTVGDYTVEVTYENGCSAVSSPTTVTACSSSDLVITSVITTPDAVEVNHAVELTVFYSSSLSADFTVKWDNEATETFPQETDGIFNAAYVYHESGVYTITVKATDPSGNVAISEKTVVVFNPDDGFVTGGGWFKSLPVKRWNGEGTFENGLRLVKNYSGLSHFKPKVHFNFAVKYNKGKTVPAGHVNLYLQGGGFIFTGTAIDWLVIKGDTHALVQCSGTINGSGNYGLLITAFDGIKNSHDKIRIKIWDMEDNNAVLYDNLTETNITGSIVIHKAKNKSAILPEQSMKPPCSKVELKIYPNPFSERLRIEFSSPESTTASLEIYDRNGRLVKTLMNSTIEAGIRYQAEFESENLSDNMYICKLTIGNRIYTRKVVYLRE